MGWHSGNSLIRNRTPLGTYRRPMARVVRGVLGGLAFFYKRGTPAGDANLHLSVEEKKTLGDDDLIGDAHLNLASLAECEVRPLSFSIYVYTDTYIHVCVCVCFKYVCDIYIHICDLYI